MGSEAVVIEWIFREADATRNAVMADFDAEIKAGTGSPEYLKACRRGKELIQEAELKLLSAWIGNG